MNTNNALIPLLKPDQRWNSLKQDNGALSQSMERAKTFTIICIINTIIGDFCRRGFNDTLLP